MAQKRYDKKITVREEVEVFTVPDSKVNTIIGMSVANLSTDVASVDIYIDNGSEEQTEGDNNIYLIQGVEIEPNASFVAVGAEQKIVMVSKEKMVAKSDQNVDIMVSVVETDQ